MKRSGFAVVSLLCISAAIVVAAETNHLSARLTGIDETNPSTIITDGTGTFSATVNNDATITYTLTYKNLSTPVTQSHIHIGATKITGGISIFLCTNLGNGPAGTPACPNDATNSGMATHTVSAADVVGPAGQGVAVGDLRNALRAIASHVAYANVHTTAHPAGEIRGQIRQHGDDEDDELPGAR